MKPTDRRIQAALKRVLTRTLVLKAKDPTLSDEAAVQQALGEERLAHGTDPHQIVRVRTS